MMENIEEGNLARRVFSGEESLVDCPISRRRCQIRGHYWKCYLDGYRKCDIYKDYEIKRDRRV